MNNKNIIAVHHNSQCVTDIYICGYCFHSVDGKRVSPPDVREQTPKEFKEGKFFDMHGQQLLPFKKILLDQ